MNYPQPEGTRPAGASRDHKPSACDVHHCSPSHAMLPSSPLAGEEARRLREAVGTQDHASLIAHPGDAGPPIKHPPCRGWRYRHGRTPRDRPGDAPRRCVLFPHLCPQRPRHLARSACASLHAHGVCGMRWAARKPMAWRCGNVVAPPRRCKASVGSAWESQPGHQAVPSTRDHPGPAREGERVHATVDRPARRTARASNGSAVVSPS